MSVCAIILAAGKGSRMQSKYHKGTHKICGKEMINIIIEKLKNCNVLDINLVVGEYRESLISVIKDNDNSLSYSIQDQQLGTGHAVLSALKFLKNRNGKVLIFACDMPLLEEESIRRLIDIHDKEGNSLTFITSILDDALSYGRVLRKDGKVSLIKEAKDCNCEELLIREINSSVYCFDIQDLLNSINKIKNSNAQNEFYLTDIVEIFNLENKKVGTITLDSNQVVGVDSRKQLYYANEILRKKINEFHMKNGVTLLDANSTYIDLNVKIGKDVIIHPNVCIQGDSIIEDDCEIFSNTRIENSFVGSFTKIESSVICNSKIGKSSSVGPFAYIRPNSKIGNEVKIGDFVEIKNSSVGDGSKISHLSYVGDADVGKGCNLGCGIVTVNYDGKNKNKTIIEDNCFVGCNVNLIAPVVVEESSYVAAGTTVTKKVDSGSLAIGRSRQKNIKDWACEKLNK